MLRLTRQTLFPGSCIPSSSTPVPSEVQIRQIRDQCAINLSSLIPRHVQDSIWKSQNKQTEGDDEMSAMNAEIAHELDIWSDAYLNKHVAYSILELLLVRVMPELGEERVSELLGARIS